MIVPSAAGLAALFGGFLGGGGGSAACLGCALVGREVEGKSESASGATFCDGGASLGGEVGVAEVVPSGGGGAGGMGMSSAAA